MALALFLIAVLICTTIVVGYLFRYDLREAYHNYRIGRLGNFVWYQIKVTGSAESSSDESNISDMGYIKSLLQAMTMENTYKTWYMDRGMFNAVWVKNPTTGFVEFFMGITAAHDKGGNLARLIAGGMNGEAVRIKRPPFFPNKGIRIIWRQEVKFGNLNSDNKVTGQGHVAKALSDTWSHLQNGESAAVFLSAEQIRTPAESSSLRAYLNESTIQKAGQVAAAPSTADKSAILSEGFRCSIASATNTGNIKLASDSLNATDGALTTSGFKTVTSSPVHQKNKVMAPVLGFVMSIVAVLFSVPLFSLWAFLVSFTPLLASFAILPFLSSRANEVFARMLARGEVAIPPYVSKFVNPLRSFLAAQNAGKAVAGDENVRSRNRVAEPSARQVIYLHFGAMFEYLSFPDVSDANVDIEARRTRSIGLPPDFEFYDEGAIYLGKSGKGQPVSYSIDDLPFSLFTTGIPGSGKSNLLKTIFAGCVYHGVNKTRGCQITPVWGETKGDGAYDAVRVAMDCGAQPFFIDFNNPKNPYKLRLEGRSFNDGASIEEVQESVSNFVSGIQAAWGDGVKGASRDALYAFILIAMLLTPYEIKWLGLDPVIDVNDISVIDLAYYLTGADASFLRAKDGEIIRLMEELDNGAINAEVPPEKRGSTKERDDFLVQVIGSFSQRFFTPQGARESAQTINSTQNKLSDMRKLRSAWRKPVGKHRSVSFSDLIGSGRPVIVNMGGYISDIDQDGNRQYSGVDMALSRRMIAIFNYLLWNHIKMTCNGWQELKRYTPVFYDEAADVAQTAQSEDVPDVLQQATKEGRSFGAGYFLGCQTPEQLPKRTKEMVLNFRSKIWFQLNSADGMEMAVRDLNPDNVAGSREITGSNIRYLNVGEGMGILRSYGKTTPEFTLRTPDFRLWRHHLAPGAHESMVEAIQNADVVIDG